MGTRCRALIAGLLLTMVCQSVLPCGCAMCGLPAKLCTTESTCEKTCSCLCHCHCGHEHDDAAQDSETAFSEIRQIHHDHEDSCPPRPDSTCRQHVVYVSAPSPELQLLLGVSFDIGEINPLIADDAAVFRGFLTSAGGGFSPGASSLLTRGVRLQV